LLAHLVTMLMQLQLIWWLVCRCNWNKNLEKMARIQLWFFFIGPILNQLLWPIYKPRQGCQISYVFSYQKSRFG
jgi:hypothetical protein